MANVSRWKRGLVSFLAVVVLMPGFAVVNGGTDTSKPTAPNMNSIAEYKDIPNQAYYSQALQVFTMLGTIAPSPEGTFDPQHRMTRGEFAALLAAALFLPDDTATAAFTDMGNDQPNAGAVNALYAKGVIKGFADRTFRPDEPITRAETAAMLAKSFELPDMPDRAAEFRDIPSGAWYAGAVGALINYRVITGRSAHLYAPDSVVTKAESITFLYRKLYRVFRIDRISDGSVTIDGEDYTVSESLAGLFQPSNRDALMHAKINFTPRDHRILSIEGLELTPNNPQAESADVVEFNGGGSTINGSLIVGRDKVKLSNLTIKGDVFITENVKHQLFTDQLDVEGDTYLLANPSAQPEDELRLTFNKTSFGTLLISRNVRLNQAVDDEGTKADTNSAQAASKKRAKEVNASAVTSDQINSLYIAYFGRPADMEGLSYFQSILEFDNLSTSIINSIYNNLFSGDWNNDSMSYWSSAILNGGVSNAILAFAQSLENLGNSVTALISNISVAQVHLDSGNFNITAAGNTDLTVGMLATVSNLVLNHAATLHLTGSIENVSIQNIAGDAPSDTSTELTGSGTIASLTVTDTADLIKLGNLITINNLVPPAGVSASQLISNFNEISSQVKNINGQQNPTNVVYGSSPSSNNGNPPAAAIPTVTSVTYSIAESGGGLTGTFTAHASHAVKLYYVFSPYEDSSAPSAAQVKAGQTAGGNPPANGSTGNVAAASGQAVFNIPNLAAGEFNTIHIVAENVNGVLSAVKSLIFKAEDAARPMVDHVSYSTAEGLFKRTDVTFTVDTRNTSTLYYVILFPGTEGNSDAPSAEQIKAGHSASGNPPATNGKAGSVSASSSSVPSIFTVELISLLTYNVYFVAEDSNGVLSIPYSQEISTPLWP
ncbi:S-layer homology domain-containing protein [Cohnella cellulosilytica]|uniref:S-layer homology domain-containing protein n=1 Tax=Cohnella cellulosilytica TaxID=986710 RepID=A0ABW2FM05_9BACL